MDAITSLWSPIWAVLGTTNAVALGTWILAFVTLWLCFVTRKLALAAQKSLKQQTADSKQRTEDSKTELKVRLHLEMEQKFESREMLAARRALALTLLAPNPPHDIVREFVPNFFESLGILNRRGLLDNDITFNTFSFYATRLVDSLQRVHRRGTEKTERNP